MDKNLAIGFAIGGTVTATFRQAMNTSIAKIDSLGKEIAGLNAQGKNLSLFKTMKRELPQAEQAWKEATSRVAALSREMAKAGQPVDALRPMLARANRETRRLAKAMSETSTPSQELVEQFNAAKKRSEQLSNAFKTATRNAKSLSSDFERAKTIADKAKVSFEKKREALHKVRAEMARTGLSTRDLVAGETKLQSALKKTQAQYAALSRNQQALTANSARRGELRGQMVDAVALAASLGAPIKAAIGFESAMADVRKVVNFPEPDGLKKFGSQLKAMSREIPISAEGLAQIAAAGGQLGIAAGDLGAFTNTVAKMSTAFDMAPDEAGDAMAKLSNIFQIPIGEMASLGDAINHLSDNTAAKARDIVPVLARVGGTAKQFGLSAIQVAALGDAFIALGKPPEVAATAINAMLLKLQTATRQGKPFQLGLDAMGVSARDLEKAIAKDGQAALIGFLEQLSAIDGQERAGILSDLFGLEYADDISLLSGSLDQYRKALGLVGDQAAYAGSMQREFTNRSATTENRLNLLKNSVTELGINIGSVLLPAVNTIAKVFTSGSVVLADMSEKFPRLTAVLTGVAAGLVATKVAAISLGYAWTFVKGGALVLNGMLARMGIILSWTTIKTALLATAQKAWAIGSAVVTAATAAISTGFRAMGVAVMSNPIGLVIGGIALAATLLITYWEPVSGFFVSLWATVKEAFSGAWDSIVGGLSTAWEKIKSLFSSGVGYLVKLWEMSPLGLLFQAGEALAGLVGIAAPSPVFSGAPSYQAPVFSGGFSEPAALSPLRSNTTSTSTTTISAPITVHAAPGMDEKKLAEQVGIEMDKRAAYGRARQRGALHD